MLKAAARRGYRFAARCWPFYGGSYSITRNRVTRWMYRDLVGERTAVLRNGVRLQVDPTDMNGRMMDILGTADLRVVAICQSLLRKGDVFFDIGANYGSVGLQCLDAVGPSGRIFLVEPQPELAQRIAGGIARARLTNVELHQVALLDHDGVATLSRPRGHSGAGSISEALGGQGESFEVPLVDARAFVETRSVGRACGLKIDVEGVGHVVLDRVLSLPSIRFIVFEANAREQPEKMIKAVRDAGYQLFGISRNIFSVRLDPVASAADIRHHHDMLAIRAALPPAQDGQYKLATLAKLAR